MRIPVTLSLTCLLVLLTGCSTMPVGINRPGRMYNVTSLHNGFTGTQSLSFSDYRVNMRFDAGELVKSNLKRGALGGLLGCSTPGCGVPRSLESMPLDIVFTGPAGVTNGWCRAAAEGLACELGEVHMRFNKVALGLGAWTAQTAIGPLRVESRDIDDGGRRAVEWRVFDRSGSVVSIVTDTLPTGGEPYFRAWIADAHPADHEALAKVVGTLLAYAWHTTR